MFDDAGEGGGGERGKVAGGGEDFVVLDGLGRVGHVDGGGAAGDVRFAASIAEGVHLGDEVADGEASETGVFGAAVAGGQVAVGAGANVGLAAVSDD